MYGPLKRVDDEARNEYTERVHTTKRKHALHVTRVLPLGESEDEVEVVNALRHNEWAGRDSRHVQDVSSPLGGRNILFISWT